MQMQTKLTQWNKFGDHELVKEITNQEFEYQEAKEEGAGVINKWTIIYPGQYIVEINNEFIGVISKEKAEKILN
jgi:hypothetical protein